MFNFDFEKYKIPIALSLLGVVLIIGGMVHSNISKTKSQPDFPKESLVNDQKISVDVSGAVKSPGVYELGSSDRVQEAISAAGGFSATASAEYIAKTLNLASKLADGMKIYIPFKGEPTAPVSAGFVNQGGVVGQKIGGVVSINTATQAELEALPGIGPVTASKIISGRPYQSIDDLTNKKVVGKSVFMKIKSSISL